MDGWLEIATYDASELRREDALQGLPTLLSRLHAMNGCRVTSTHHPATASRNANEIERQRVIRLHHSSIQLGDLACLLAV